MNSIVVDQRFKSVQSILKLTFGIVPIVAGIDKFTNLLTDWTQYLSPAFLDISPVSAEVFMMIVGVIEIIAGIIVLSRPALGGIIVAGWLTVIALTLLTSGHYLDVAVRDLVMAISAYAMSKLTRVRNEISEDKSTASGYLFNNNRQMKKETVK
jgi:uncharacterized membrane protein YphA (DoxX/SURF4 family)